MNFSKAIRCYFSKYPHLIRDIRWGFVSASRNVVFKLISGVYIVQGAGAYNIFFYVFYIYIAKSPKFAINNPVFGLKSTIRTTNNNFGVNRCKSTKDKTKKNKKYLFFSCFFIKHTVQFVRIVSKEQNVQP